MGNQVGDASTLRFLLPHRFLFPSSPSATTATAAGTQVTAKLVLAAAQAGKLPDCRLLQKLLNHSAQSTLRDMTGPAAAPAGSASTAAAGSSSGSSWPSAWAHPLSLALRAVCTVWRGEQPPCPAAEVAFSAAFRILTRHEATAAPLAAAEDTDNLAAVLQSLLSSSVPVAAQQEALHDMLDSFHNIVTSLQQASGGGSPSIGSAAAVFRLSKAVLAAAGSCQGGQVFSGATLGAWEAALAGSLSELKPWVGTEASPVGACPRRLLAMAALNFCSAGGIAVRAATAAGFDALDRFPMPNLINAMVVCVGNLHPSFVCQLLRFGAKPPQDAMPVVRAVVAAVEAAVEVILSAAGGSLDIVSESMTMVACSGIPALIGELVCMQPVLL